MIRDQAIDKPSLPFKLILLVILLVSAASVFIIPSLRHLSLAMGFIINNEPPEGYIIPVAGVVRSSLEPSFGAPRPEGRKHEGIDIFAEKGREIFSATDGFVCYIGLNRRGGNTVWIVGEGRRLYYYAHLDRYAPDIRRWQIVRAGQIIGYVGKTGNAENTAPHLHFGIYEIILYQIIQPLGQAIDPYPLLKEKGRTISISLRE